MFQACLRGIKTIFLLLAFSGAFSALGWCADPGAQPSSSPSPLPTAVLKLNLGEPVTAQWPDGRVATLKVKRDPGILTTIFLQIDENSCTEKTGVLCTYYGSVKQDVLQLQWSTHPDSKKIGKVVVLHYQYPQGSPQELTLQTAVDLFFPDKYINPVAASSLQNDRIFCEDYSWLPLGGHQAPDSLIVDRWDSESMTDNPETGASENRSDVGAMGVSLTPNEAGALEIRAVKNFTSNSPYFISMISGPILSWTLKQNTGEFCQISFKVNTSKVLAQLNHHLMDLPDAWSSYLYGSDEYSTQNLNLIQLVSTIPADAQ